jgi:LacI family transcriptional regulator
MNKLTTSLTGKDIAKIAGVSVATVSRILNGSSGYSEATRKKVMTIINELGYKQNAIARNLKTKKTHTIGVLMPRVGTTYYVRILDGIEDVAQKFKYNVLFCHNISATEEYLNIFFEQQVDVIIICSLSDEEKTDKMLLESGIPCMFISTLSCNYPIPYIKIDDFQASYAATTYLINMGHKRIAMLSGNDGPVAGVPRLNGYKQAMLDHGMTVNENLIKETDFQYNKGLAAASELLDGEEVFTAIVACCDDVAVAAINEIYKRGMEVPRDYSIIGFDNTTVAEMSNPPLTTISQPLYQMGQEAVEILLKNIEDGTAIENKIMPFEIVERKSVRRL